MTYSSYPERIPLLHALNNTVDGLIRWCTPSIHPRVPRVRGFYENDISISYHKFGNPSLNTGIFGLATQKAAEAFGSDNTLFSVNGSTGSNFIVMRSIAKQLGQVHILAQRNIHKSISVACEDYGINLNFLEPHFDQHLEIFIPNTISEYVAGLKKHPKTNVVLITNPTYEGLSLNLKKLITTLRNINPELIIFVDEAWGAHFHFSDRLPNSAMSAGADVCVQSTHKMGTGLQQSSMIHHRGNRLKYSYVLQSYQDLSTTSPSFHLLASLDSARYFMQTYGDQAIYQRQLVAHELRKQLQDIPELRVLSTGDLKKKYLQIASVDDTKVIVNVKDTKISGPEIASLLESEYQVVVEKSEQNNILFVGTFQVTNLEARQTAYYLSQVIDFYASKRDVVVEESPYFPTTITRRISLNEVSQYNTQFSSLENGIVGQICAENVVPYPPGIPLITKGEEITQEHVDYLKYILDKNSSIEVLSADTTLNSLLTISNI